MQQTDWQADISDQDNTNLMTLCSRCQLCQDVAHCALGLFGKAKVKRSDVEKKTFIV